MSVNKVTQHKTLFIGLLALLPTAAFAHQEADGSGFLAGLTHPIFGLDHLLAMVSVGILSAQLGGKSIWRIPALFVAAMIGGGVIGAYQIALPYIEIGIALSVLLLGVAIYRSNHKTRPVYIMTFVAFFGVFHGHAHGMEMPNSASPVFYTFGFICSTATLHLIGVFMGEAFMRRERFLSSLRYMGSAISGIGFFMFLQHIGIA